MSLRDAETAEIAPFRRRPPSGLSPYTAPRSYPPIALGERYAVGLALEFTLWAPEMRKTPILRGVGETPCGAAFDAYRVGRLHELVGDHLHDDLHAHRTGIRSIRLSD